MQNPTINLINIEDLDLNQYKVQVNDIQAIEKKRKFVAETEKKSLIYLFLSIFLFYFAPAIGETITEIIVLPVTFILAISGYFLSFLLLVNALNLFNNIRPLKFEIKSWFLSHRFSNSFIEDALLLDEKTYKQLTNFDTLNQCITKSSVARSFTVDDYLVFKYKKKFVECIDFSIVVGSGKNSKTYYYLALAVKNPDKITGTTASCSDWNWNFKLPHEVETESIVFNKMFKTTATSQIDARLHLKTNVMQDMIDLNNSISTKKSLFYFKDSQMLFVLNLPKNYFELDYTKPLTDQQFNKEFETELNKCLKIFDDFWMDRKAHLEGIN